MSLTDHARAARIIGESLTKQAAEGPDVSRIVVHNIGLAYLRAALQMEAEVRAEFGTSYKPG